jgi:hypothetical protein
MADILISYASVDRPFAHRLAEALEAFGWTVWWDHRNLRGGQHFDRVIEEAISDAGVVIVVWSRNSIESGWVRDEATLALEKEKLLPLRIDTASLPMRFRNIHTIDLSSWIGETEAEPFKRLVGDLRHYLGPSNSSDRIEHSGTRVEPTPQAAPTDIPGRGSVSGNQQPPALVGDAATAWVAYERGDYATALNITRPAAERGDPAAQSDLGVLHANGQGVPQDYAEAMRWYRKAADQGHAGAQNNIGLLYTDGQGVKQDHAEAMRWLRKAADQGSALAQYNIGMLHANGQGVPRNLAQARAWMQKAAAAGDESARNWLAKN